MLPAFVSVGQARASRELATVDSAATASKDPALDTLSYALGEHSFLTWLCDDLGAYQLMWSAHRHLLKDLLVSTPHLLVNMVLFQAPQPYFCSSIWISAGHIYLFGPGKTACIWWLSAVWSSCDCLLIIGVVIIITRCYCRRQGASADQQHLQAAKTLSLVGHARSKQDTINRGHGLQSDFGYPSGYLEAFHGPQICPV